MTLKCGLVLPKDETENCQDYDVDLSRYCAIKKIEITSWKARAYGIFTRVGEVTEIERVSAANE